MNGRAKTAGSWRSWLHDGRWALLFVGVLLACVATGVLRNDNAQQMRGLYQQLGQAQQLQDQLQEEHSRLLLEKGAHSSLLKVEQIARDELDMAFPVHMDEVAP